MCCTWTEVRSFFIFLSHNSFFPLDSNIFVRSYMQGYCDSYTMPKIICGWLKFRILIFHVWWVCNSVDMSNSNQPLRHVYVADWISQTWSLNTDQCTYLFEILVKQPHYPTSSAFNIFKMCQHQIFSRFVVVVVVVGKTPLDQFQFHFSLPRRTHLH